MCFLVTLALILLPWIVIVRFRSGDYLCSHTPWRFSKSCVEYRTHNKLYRQGNL